MIGAECTNHQFVRGSDMMDFVAIDFETATSGAKGICSMGICTVSDGAVKERRELLIKPEPFEFNEYNIKIHNITPEMVIDKPTFKEYWSEIFPYLNDRLVVAHNASFDIGALLKTLDMYKIEFPNFSYLCTVKLSQKAYPDLESHKLNAMAEFIGLDFEHHRANDDAYVCARVLLKILEDFKINTLEELVKRFGIGVGKICPDFHLPCTKNEKKASKKSEFYLQLQ